MMRKNLSLIAASIIMALSCQPTLANYELSSGWFGGLDADERRLLQSRLILTGHYSALADGEFGQMTYRAITELQRDLGEPATGVLSGPSLEALAAASAKIYQDLGMDIVEDQRGRLTLIVPLSLLPEREDTRRGTAYVSADSSIRLETIRKPLSEQSFSELYDALSTPTSTRRIVYRVFDAGRFVVSGTAQDRSFYIYFSRTPSDSVGYSVEWSPEGQALGSMLATFLASYSVPTALDGEIKTDDYVAAAPPTAAPSRKSPANLSAGTGFFVSRQGLIITNHHVVEGCATVVIPGYGEARVVSVDADLDLAAIKIDREANAWATIRTRPVELAEDVVVLGYPLADLMGSSLSVGTGIVSSETGLGGSENWFTTNVGLQPGNSGGPLLDSTGLVVGVAVAKLNDEAMMADSGNVAPNFGFAIKNTELLEFLDIFRTTTAEGGASGKPLPVKELAHTARAYTVQVLCKG